MQAAGILNGSERIIKGQDKVFKSRPVFCSLEFSTNLTAISLASG
jgi:hypothetical protein